MHRSIAARQCLAGERDRRWKEPVGRISSRCCPPASVGAGPVRGSAAARFRRRPETAQSGEGRRFGGPREPRRTAKAACGTSEMARGACSGGTVDGRKGRFASSNPGFGRGVLRATEVPGSSTRAEKAKAAPQGRRLAGEPRSGSWEVQGGAGWAVRARPAEQMARCLLRQAESGRQPPGSRPERREGSPDGRLRPGQTLTGGRSGEPAFEWRRLTLGRVISACVAAARREGWARAARPGGRSARVGPATAKDVARGAGRRYQKHSSSQAASWPTWSVRPAHRLAGRLGIDRAARAAGQQRSPLWMAGNLGPGRTCWLGAVLPLAFAGGPSTVDAPADRGSRSAKAGDAAESRLARAAPSLVRRADRVPCRAPRAFGRVAPLAGFRARSDTRHERGDSVVSRLVRGKELALD